MKITRRTALKTAIAGAAATTSACKTNDSHNVVNDGQRANKQSENKKPVEFAPMWQTTHDRVWLGPNVWANPMEDWRIVDGAAETVYQGGNRSVHSLTHELRFMQKSFKLDASIQRLHVTDRDRGAGFRIGMRNEIDDYRSSCFEQKGIDAGVLENTLVLGDQRAPLGVHLGSQTINLQLIGKPIRANKTTNSQDAKLTRLTLKAFIKGQHVASVSATYPSVSLIGNVGVVSNFTIKALAHRDAQAKDLGSRYRFSNWRMSGDAFLVSPERAYGPILWCMYTLSDSRGDDGFVLKLSAFTGPLRRDDQQQLDLQININDRWRTIATEAIDTDAWLATFKINNWKHSHAVSYRVRYKQRLSNGEQEQHFYTGTIRSNPTQGKLKMAALTCQNDYAFPYSPVANNIEALDPDLLFFSGDQIYESHGGFGIIRAPAEQAITNYLRKFYQFGWAFGDLMRHRPTVCLPDDHDVLQGNLWGEAGAAMQQPETDPSASILGGYIEPVRMINAVHRTCVSHHPDPVEPMPSSRAMSVYYTDMVFGNVSFAIIADRQWKSGPERINVTVGVTGNDEAPQYINPAFNPDGLELLGKRQEAFLSKWSADWRGHNLKAVLSQTVFAGLATHQPQPERYLKYDFDSSGWPAKARDRAISIMRNSQALHICGDTHLGTLSQYGVNTQRDSNWAFCTPAIAAGWPRWWQPDAAGLPHTNRPMHKTPQTGEYLDSFGNKVYVYAAANPEVGVSDHRYEKAHQKGSGFGFIEFDTQAQTYTVSAYRFLVDALQPPNVSQFSGWPVTIHKGENIGINRLS